MKTKSIIYQSFVPNTEIKPALSQDNNPSFKYTGYKPRYKWSDDDSTTEDTTSTETTNTPEDVSTSDQITFQDPTSIDWSKIAGYENQPIITESQSTPATTRPRGKHVFKDPSIQVGEMQGLLDAFADAGISLRITSGTRPGAHTAQGKLSNHAIGRALDVTPVAGQTFEDLAEAIRNAPDLVAYMKKHGYGIYNETSPEALARTKGTGAHWHLGPDDNAIKGLETILKGKQGLKIPILFAKERTKTQRYATRKEQKRIDRVTEMILHELNKENRNISPVTGLRYEEPLQPLTQEIASFLPGVGDAIEASSIIGNLLNNNWKQALISAGLLALPGNASKISKTLGFKYPYSDLEYITKSGNLIKNRGIDKEIKNTESLLAKRYSTKGNRIPELPQELNGEQVSDIIQNWEPQIREVVTPLDGARASNQIGWYRHDNSNNQPLDVSIGDKNLTTKELNTEFTPEINNYPISEESRRQMLDHELSHWLDYTFRPEIQNSEIKFLTEGTEEAVKDPFEIIARTGQVKSYNKISDGSQTFTGDQYKKMFENYINDKRNPDNYISLLKQRIKDWDAFAKWANENIPLATKPLKPFLWTPQNSEEND